MNQTRKHLGKSLNERYASAPKYILSLCKYYDPEDKNNDLHNKAKITIVRITAILNDAKTEENIEWLEFDDLEEKDMGSVFEEIFDLSDKYHTPIDLIGEPQPLEKCLNHPSDETHNVDHWLTLADIKRLKGTMTLPRNFKSPSKKESN